MNIKIPNLIISFPLLAAPEHVLDGGCFIDTHHDSGNVEEEEHEDGYSGTYCWSPYPVICYNTELITQALVIMQRFLHLTYMWQVPTTMYM